MTANTNRYGFIAAEETNWQRCPRCNTSNIQADRLSADDEIAYGTVACDDCGFQWTEVYKAAWREWQ